MQNGQGVLIVCLCALAFFLAFLVRFFEEYQKSASKIENDAERLDKRIEITKTTIQSVVLIGIAATVVLNWYQDADLNQHKIRLDRHNAIESAIVEFQSTNRQIRLTALAKLGCLIAESEPLHQEAVNGIAKAQLDQLRDNNDDSELYQIEITLLKDIIRKCEKSIDSLTTKLPTPDVP